MPGWAPAGPRPVWELDLGPSPLVGMAVRDRLMFAGTSDGKVHAIDSLDGTLKWSIDLGGRPLSPFPAPDYLLVSGETIHGLEYADGKVKWELPKDGSTYSSIFIRSDAAFVAKNDRMMSIVPLNGSVNWVSDPLAPGLQVPASAECCTIGVYTSGGSQLFGREMANGKAMWSYSLPGKVYPGYLAIASRLIFGADDLGNFHAVSENNGSVYSTASLGAAALVAPVALGNRMLFPLDDGTLAKWSMSEMKEQWRTPLGAKPSTSPVPLYDHDWIGTDDGRLLALDDADGSIDTSFPVGSRVEGRLSSFYGMVMTTSGSRIRAHDAIPLEFVSSTLADNTSVATPKVRFAGHAMDDFFLRDIEVSNGSGWTKAKTVFTKIGYAYRADWEADLGLAPGWNELKARTVGDAGQDTVYREIKVRVFLDEEAPALNILSPADGFVTSNDSATLAGTAFDSNGLASVEGSTDFGTWAAATGLENWSVSLGLRGGTYDATVRATDLSGQSSIRSIRVTRTMPSPDTVPPSVWVEDNRTKVFSGSVLAEIRGRSADDVDLRAVEFRGAGGWHRCAGTWTFVCAAPLVEGSNLVDLRAIDTSGNSAEAEIVVVVDLRPPLHSVSFPPPEFHSRVAHLDIRGNSTDDSGVMTITVKSAGSSIQFVLPATEWWAYALLPPGNRRISVIATDLAGNNATVDLNITLDTERPKVVIELVQSRDGLTKVFGKATDDFVVERVQASGDGGATWTDATGKSSWFVSLSGNPATVLVRALDRAGNEGRAEARGPGAVFADPSGIAIVGATMAALMAGLLLAFRLRSARRVRHPRKPDARAGEKTSPGKRRQA